MKHEDARKLLNDYIDEELSSERITELENHIAECRTCCREIEELRELARHAAGLPPAIDPPSDLWPAIANAIESEAAGSKIEAARDIRPDRPHQQARDLRPVRWLRAAFRFPEIRGIPTIAGAALLAVIIFVILRPWQPPSPENIAKTEKIFVERGLGTVTRETLQALEAECRQADLEIELIASRERAPRLHPVFERMNQDLRMVSQSITEISVAWKANPDNPHLTRLLVRSYQAKVSLQKRMVHVSVIS